ncbi:hypothetical protein Baya_1033 [Bagarius yarrelli]|uniref:Jhy protein homolog n=1 Tax=Bagarius yarrelli TaxID=175774 RepID=A0A556TJY1_BAGYA|nr:hypothetical protein Baya_1033 [Bagarius yarrelli]
MDNSDTDHVYRSNNDKKKSIGSDQACDARHNDEDSPCDLWDTLESDTESLVQEKAYQRELQKRILNADAEKWEQEEGRRPQPDITQPCVGQNTKHSRQMSPSDEYADLRYDPDWRKKLQGSEFFQTDFSSEFNDSLRHAGHVYPQEKQKYLIVRSPVPSEIDAVNPKPLQSPFHLHPTQDQASGLSVPQSSPASLESTPRSDKSKNVKKRAAGILPFSSSLQKQQDEETQSLAQDPNKDSLNVVAMQRRHTEKVKPTWLREDIVERNKATLGMNIHKQGSYLKAYEQRGAKPDDAKQPLQSAEETASTDSAGSPDNALNPELMWIQKTQKLKTRNQSKHSDKVKLHHHRTKPRGHLNQQVEKQHFQTPAEKMGPLDSDSDPHFTYLSAPSVNLNTNLNTPATLAEPFITLEPQKQLYTLALPPSPHWGIRNDECNSLSYTLAIPHPPTGTVDQESIKVANKNSIRISPTQPPHQESLVLNASQPEVHYGEDPAFLLQTYSGAYPVLPPIRVSNNSDPELCRDRAEETSTIINRSSSEGSLAQLEKQKQLQAKTYTYKAYTLKDYKCLNQDVKLGGLGPSNIVAKDVSEKIRQQKLYSDVIREQNKKISRIPCLPTRSPVGRNENDIPRNKALVYAKTIAKPKAPQLKEKYKDKHGSEKVFELSASLQLKADLTYLPTIEMLRKRHEQEKQVVAGFTNIRGKLNAPSISSH